MVLNIGTMRLTKKAEYAIRAMIALGRAGDQPVTIQRIATSQGLPKKFLEQILLALKAQGLVESHAGPHGGYRLARPTESISLADILNAVGDRLASRAGKRSRSSTGSSTLETLLEDIRRCVSAKTRQISLAQLCENSTTEKQVEELMWYI
ncbi:MAG: Rrf2 family transcriptional regulator [Candidatus Hydrogenedentota bacterium]|jgi:Rrf2 family protein|nr:MAG: Rrf2 family transcriptional regulator [Candidatus Hydrogenedentota bacterium]GIX45466.1 MAG: hypothetical protein KatS3mg130_1874 [Candidatus Sumerlaea sp.]